MWHGNRMTNSIRALSLHLTRDCMRYVAGLLDHLICEEEQGWRHRDSQRLGGLEVDDELKLHGLLHRQIGGLSTLENFVHVVGDAPPALYVAHIVGHQPSRPRNTRITKHRR